MKRVIWVGLPAAVFLGLTSGTAFSDDDDDDDRYWTTGYHYAIKYICGEPGAGADKPITNADYRTAINIVNAGDDTRVSRAAIPTEGDGNAVGGNGFGTIAGFTGEEWDCPSIVPATGATTPFNKGIVVLRSCDPLEVVAVYNASRGDVNAATSPLAIDVEPIAGREIRLAKRDCYGDRQR